MNLGGVLERDPPGNFIVLLSDFSAHMGNDGESWKGVTKRNGLPDVNPNASLLFSLCVSNGLSITKQVHWQRSAIPLDPKRPEAI